MPRCPGWIARHSLSAARPHAAGKLTVWPSASRYVFAGRRIRKPRRRAYHSIVFKMNRPPTRPTATISARIGTGSFVIFQRMLSISTTSCRHAR